MHIAGDRVASVRAELLGSTRIVCDGVRLETGLSCRTLLTFAMLVTRHNDALRREEAAFALCPDLPESEARAALRRHLHLLNKAFPRGTARWIECTKSTVAWRSGGDTWVDAAEFLRLSATTDGAEDALELYSGDFLPHVDHEWAQAAREHLRGIATGLLAKAIARRKHRFDAAGCLHYVDRLLGMDPWREDVLREQLLLRFHLGDRAGALASYRRFRERLRLEFGVDPMPETLRCYERIAAGEDPNYFGIPDCVPHFATA